MKGVKKKSDAFKIIFIGDSGVGKTSIINYFSYQVNGGKKPGTPQPSTVKDKTDFTTIQYDFVLEDIKKSIKLELWDTAGQERYRALVQNYYDNADAIIFCFDLTNKESFDNMIQYWRKTCDRTDTSTKATKYRPLRKDCIFSAIGIKLDLCFTSENLNRWNKNSYMYLSWKHEMSNHAEIVAQIPTTDEQINLVDKKDFVENVVVSYEKYNPPIGNIVFFKKTLPTVDDFAESSDGSDKEKDRNQKKRQRSSFFISNPATKHFSRRNSALSISHNTTQENQSNINYIMTQVKENITTIENNDILPVFLISAINTSYYGIDIFLNNLALQLLKTRTIVSSNNPPNENTNTCCQ